MKASNLLLIAIGFMAVISCAVNVEPSQMGSNTLTEIVLTATFGDSQPTKTAVQRDGATIWWNPHEDINIFYGNSESSRFTSTNDEPAAKAHFKGTIEAFTGETESGEPNSFWAIYPYNVENTCDCTSVTLTIPANQTAMADTFSDKQWTTIAKSQGLALSFYAVGAGFRFSVTEAGITSVTFRGNKNEVLAGKAKITMDSSNRPIVQEYISPITEITLSAPDGETLAVGPLYYIAFFPQYFEQGFSVTFHTATATGTRIYDKAINFKRTDVHRGRDFDSSIIYDCKKMPLCYEAIEDGSISFEHNGTLIYKKNNSSWSTYDGNISVVAGDKVYFRGDKCLTYNDDYDFSSRFSTNTKGYIYGNIMSLYDKDDFANMTEIPDDWYAGMLFYQSAICSHPRLSLELPATTLKPCCYYRLFDGCTELTKAPTLPAATMQESCYEQMFYHCTKLESAPELPATTLATRCYYGMFSDCFSLAIAPELPATILAEECYELMFSRCSSLESSPYLPALQLQEACYWGMFYGCTNLSSIKMMADNISATGCMNGWVEDISSSGTIVLNQNASWDVEGKNGIPSGWTIAREYPYADLGLSVLWAQYNLGATRTDETGYYYSWGETGSKAEYTWETYQFGIYSNCSLQKYCNNESYGIIDQKTEIEQVDDAATSLWGSDWHIPSRENFEELKEKCMVAYYSPGKMVLTGPNGNKIFFFSSKMKDDANHYQEINTVSSTLWSSTLYSNDCKYSYAYYLMPNGIIEWGGYDRYVGFPIRPVRNR